MKIQIKTLNFSCLYKVKKLINIGSACIYSDKNKTPFIESDFDKRAMHPSVLNYGYSKLTQIWTNTGGDNNMWVDRSLGHTIANYSPELELNEFHFEKNNDFVFKTIGPRSY